MGGRLLTVFYQGEDGIARIQVRFDDGTVWQTQQLLAEPYRVAVPTIHEHLGNIFADAELDPAATVGEFLIVQPEGSREVRRAIDHYNLDVILAVGYHRSERRGVQFRRWATERLRE